MCYAAKLRGQVDVERRAGTDTDSWHGNLFQQSSLVVAVAAASSDDEDVDENNDDDNGDDGNCNS